jgi:hypothetical protein
VQGDDEPHSVADGLLTPLRDYLEQFGDARHVLRATDVACVLPVPGDPVVLGPAVAPIAIEVGEAVLVRGPDGSRALVPLTRRFGSDLEPGHHVSWQVARILDWRRAVADRIGDPEEATRGLHAELRDATSALVAMDVAHWMPDAAAQIESLRDGALGPEVLPDCLSSLRLAALTSAVRLRAIVALASSDMAATPSLHLADQRGAALREIDRAARRALSAAATFVAR